MPDIRELKDQAAKHFAKGKFDKAAADYAALCKLEPKDAQLRVRLGDACVKKGDKPAAIGAYRIAAEEYAKEGFLPRAIAVCKLILEVDPTHSETQGVLAQLYAKKSGAGRPEPMHESADHARPPAPGPAAASAPRPRVSLTKAAAVIAPAAAARAPAPASAASPDDAPLELDTAARGFTEGVALSQAEREQAAAEASGLELDADPAAEPSWKGATAAWEPPASAPMTPAPPPAEPAVAKAAPSAPTTPSPAARAAPEPRRVAPEAKKPAPAPMVEQKAVPAPEPADDVLFADEGKPEPEPQPAPKPAVSIEDVDLGEPELASQESTAPRSPLKAMPPPAAHWVAPAGSTVADSLVAALEGVGQSAAVSGEPAPAASALSSWFSEPEGTREEPGARRRPTLADLAVSSVTEDEEIEILTVNVEEPAAPAKPLPEIPLFSDLSQDAFIELTSQCALKRCTAGEVVIAQGSVGSSFFILTSGTVKVVRAAPPSGEVVLARLTEGSFFGEMALLSGAPRAASVVAEDEAECLEISAELLANLTKKWPHVGQALKKFCRQRLLANVMATSPLFKPFDKDDRKALVEKFKAREVLPGETILVEGQQVDGLYVVMAGEVEVKKKKDDGEVTLASLREGEVFGEISLLTKSAATATVAAIRASTILRLPRSTFDEVISTHPQILALVSELSDDRLKAQQAFEQSKADGLLLL